MGKRKYGPFDNDQLKERLKQSEDAKRAVVKGVKKSEESSKNDDYGKNIWISMDDITEGMDIPKSEGVQFWEPPAPSKAKYTSDAEIQKLTDDLAKYSTSFNDHRSSYLGSYIRRSYTMPLEDTFETMSTKSTDPDWAIEERNRLEKEDDEYIINHNTDPFEAFKKGRTEIVLRKNAFESKLQEYKRGLCKASDVISNEKTLAEDRIDDEDEECVINIAELAQCLVEEELESSGLSIEEAKEQCYYQMRLEHYVSKIKSFKRNTNA